MHTRQRLAIVAGDIDQPRFLKVFESLIPHFEVTLYVLASESFTTIHESALKCRVYNHVPDMPGYMRDLESDLATMDLVIGLETSKLSTFQAIRAARKNRIPAFVIVTESQPLFYEKYPNIRAIQFDICNAATFFWATSQAARDTLVVEGVSSQKIGTLKPTIDTKRFRINDGLRKKFRTYVGLRAEDLIVVCRCDLDPSYNLIAVLEALRLLRQQGTPHSLRCKILFVGDGSMARDLKLKACDLGIGAHVMFLHQNPEPFLPDLFNAADFYLSASITNMERPEIYPMSLLEAMACGVVPIVPAGSVGAELCHDKGFQYNSSQLSSLVSGLFHAIHDPRSPETHKVEMSEFIHGSMNGVSTNPAFAKEVMDLMRSSATSKSSQTSPAEMLRSIASDIENSRHLDALIKIEEAELQGFEAVPCLAELACLKGDALYNLGRMDEAMTAYSTCMQLEPNSPNCLRGLGFLAWHGHSNEEALTFFKKALALNENDLGSAYGIGLIYRRLGLLDEALYWLESCVLKSQHTSSAVIALAQTCAQLTPRSKAIDALERALDTVGDHQALMATLGQLYVADGLLDRGKQLLEKAMQMNNIA